jgi:hypothetical protein
MSLINSKNNEILVIRASLMMFRPIVLKPGLKWSRIRVLATAQQLQRGLSKQKIIWRLFC